MRIAPWQTLAQRAIDFVRGEVPDGAIVRDLGRTIYGELVSQQPLTVEPIRDAGASAQAKVTAARSATIERIETFGRASVIQELVGTVATIVEEKAADVVKTAQTVADITKCVSIVGAVVHVVEIYVRCIRMMSEASRSRPCLPRLHLELVSLLECTLQFAMVVVFAESAIDDLRSKHAFYRSHGFAVEIGKRKAKEFGGRRARFR